MKNIYHESTIQVHKKLGPGFLESIYENAIAPELKSRGINSETQKEINVYYDGQEIGLHRLDLVVENEIIVELKAVNEFEDIHLAQLMSCLKAANLKVGLLLNFAKPVLKIKRVVN